VRGPRRVALLGKPNVGKSSLLNKLVGEERVVVDATAGTTRDPVDEIVELGGRTGGSSTPPGIRRRVHQTSGRRLLRQPAHAGALEKAEVAVVLVDAAQPITEQDTRIVSMVEESAAALFVAYNKWDLLDGTAGRGSSGDRARHSRPGAVGPAGQPLALSRTAPGPHRTGARDGA
jgi:GTP-binding protein